MKQPYQWPDISVLTESAWKAHDWPSTKDVTDEDIDNFEAKYPDRNVDFNLFVFESKVAPVYS